MIEFSIGLRGIYASGRRGWDDKTDGKDGTGGMDGIMRDGKGMTM